MEVAVAIALTFSSLCPLVEGFASSRPFSGSLSVVAQPSCSFSCSTQSTTRSEISRAQGRCSVVALAGIEGTEGEEDPLETYKRQMTEFMTSAHEKRLQAMQAVKAEAQRGYEEQIKELQAQVRLRRWQFAAHVHVCVCVTGKGERESEREAPVEIL